MFKRRGKGRLSEERKLTHEARMALARAESREKEVQRVVTAVRQVMKENHLGANVRTALKGR